MALTSEQVSTLKRYLEQSEAMHHRIMAKMTDPKFDLLDAWGQRSGSIRRSVASFATRWLHSVPTRMSAQLSTAVGPGQATTSGRLIDDFCDGVVHFGNVDWWYHNRGHASVRMATRIAHRVPTLWINSIGMRMPVPGRTEIAGARYLRKLKSLTKGLRRDPQSGMYIYSPVFIPRYSRRMLEINGRLLALQVRFVCNHLGIRRPSALVSMPTMTPAVERLSWARVVFDRCDDFSTFPGADAPLISSLERQLLSLSDAAVYVHEGLMKSEIGRVRRSVYIGHGVDFNRYVAARPDGRPSRPAPAPLAGIRHPVVGFFGGMDEVPVWTSI